MSLECRGSVTMEIYDGREVCIRRLTRADDSAISAASSEARRESWVWAKEGTSTAIFLCVILEAGVFDLYLTEVLGWLLVVEVKSVIGICCCVQV